MIFFAQASWLFDSTRMDILHLPTSSKPSGDLNTSASKVGRYHDSWLFDSTIPQGWTLGTKKHLPTRTPTGSFTDFGPFDRQGPRKLQLECCHRPGGGTSCCRMLKQCVLRVWRLVMLRHADPCLPFFGGIWIQDMMGTELRAFFWHDCTKPSFWGSLWPSPHPHHVPYLPISTAGIHFRTGLG